MLAVLPVREFLFSVLGGQAVLDPFGQEPSVRHLHFLAQVHMFRFHTLMERECENKMN